MSKKDKNTPLKRDVGFEVKETPSDPMQDANADGGSLSASTTVIPAEQKQIKKKKTYISDFEVKETLGQGSFGAVVEATEKANGRDCAIKILNKEFIIQEKKEKYVKIERNILSLCKHPRICALYKTFSSPEDLYYVLELCPNGELLDHIKVAGSCDLASTQFYTAEIVQALEYLHSLGIIHRDLKPENILLSKDMHVKITDFGTAKLLGDDLKSDPTVRVRTNSFVGTAEYLAPELLESKETCRASDFFALGSIVFQMLTGQPPFKGKTDYLTMEKVKAREIEFHDEFPAVAKDLVERLLTIDPDARLGSGADGYAQLKAHAFFDGIDWDNLDNTTPPPIKSSGLREKILGVEGVPVPVAVAAAKATGQAEAGEASANGALVYAPEEEQSKWKEHLMEGERVLKAGTVLKYKGMSVKKRHLLLTDKPRILYIDPVKSVVKGEIPWSSSVYAVAKNTSSFYINTPERKYVLQDKAAKDAEGWVRSIEAVHAAQAGTGTAS